MLAIGAGPHITRCAYLLLAGHQRLLGVVAAAVLLVMLIGAGTGTLPPVLDATPAATGIFATCVAAVYCCPWRPRQRRSRPFPWRRAVDEGAGVGL